MSKPQPFLVSLAVVLGLGVAAGAAPKRRTVPVLPPLNAAAANQPAAEAPAPAAPPPAPAGGETDLYQGQAPDQSGLTLTPWGGGSVEDDTDLYMDNGHSLLITTVDDYQGARITFNTPVSLGDLTPTRFLQMSFHFPKVEAPPPASTDPNAPTPPPAPAPRHKPKKGHAGDNSDDSDTAPVITSLRWVLTLADGRQAEVRRPLPDGAVNGHDWFSLAVPLSALKFPAGAASPLQSVTVAGDGYADISLGAIKIVSDDTPLNASAGRTQTVSAASQVLFHGTGDGGASALRYTWNFGASGTTAPEAEGQTVQTQYDTAGDYTVTLTVSDLDGIKKPATSTLVVHVQ